MKRRTAYANLQDFFEAHPELTQGHFAKRVKIAQTHLSMILKGRRTPSLPVAIRIARSANVPVESLLPKEHESDGA